MNIFGKLYPFSILLLIISFSGIAIPNKFQSDGKVAESPSLYNEGNKYLGNGQFAEAMNVWKKIMETSPENADVNFKMGLCYFNSIDEQGKALAFFKKASLKMTKEYKFYGKAADEASLDVLYFLGETFLTLNQPDSALSYFKLYQNQYEGIPPIAVDRAILMCINAKNAPKSPRNVKLTNLGKVINSEFAEANPVAKLDNSMLFFSSRRPGKENKNQVDKINGKFSQDIYYTAKDATGKWREPQAFRFNSALDEYPVFVSPDGLTLYFCRKGRQKSSADWNTKIHPGDNFNIYRTKFLDGVWSKPIPLSEINSPFNETGLSITGDGKTLYFSSDRPGGIGKSDIYRCLLKSNGKWGAAQNLGKGVNSAYNEISPFINPNGKTLFFSSNGSLNQGIGGYDVYYSELLKDNKWENPQTLGYPINKTRDDVDYYIISGGKRYLASLSESKSYDIYEIEGGGFDVEAVEMGTEVVTLTKEMNVTEVMETEKLVEKEVEVVQTVETEVEVIKEVEVKDTSALSELRLSSEKKLEMVKAEAGILKAQAEIAAAERAKANVEIARANEEIAKANAEKAKANAIIAEAEKIKAEAEKLKALAIISESDKICAETEKIKALAKISEAEKAIAEAVKVKSDLAIAKIWKKTAKQKAKLAEAEKVKAESEKALAEKAKLEAEAQLKTAEAQIAKTMSDKAMAEKAKAEAEIAAMEKTKAEAGLAKLETEKLKSEQALAEANLAIQKAASEKTKYEAEILSAQKSKTDAIIQAEQAASDKALAEKAKAEALIVTENRMKADAEALKAQSLVKTEQLNADKSIAEAEKAKALILLAELEKSKADAERAKAQAMAEETKAKAEISTTDLQSKIEQAKIEQARAELETSISMKAKADADKAKADLEKAKTETEKAKADTEKAGLLKEKAEAEKEKAVAGATKAKADAERIADLAKIKQAEAEKAKTEKIK